MPALRAVLLALLLSIGVAGHSAAQQHWLQGTWTGAMTNLPPTNRFGADRTLEVTSVAPDGASASGTWTSAAAKVPLAIAIAGETVSFTSPGSAGAVYKLTRKGGIMEGSWAAVAGSAGGSLSLKKQ